MAQTTETATAEKFDLTITRVFDAPRKLVFTAWSTPEHLMRWWGPKDFVMQSAKTDFRPGGQWRTCFRSPEYQDYWAEGTYREVVEPELLVFTFAWQEEDGMGPEMLTRVTLEDLNGKTMLTFSQGVHATVESRDSHEEGWNECLDRLEAYLAAA
jgi:uncharacterized protein YndB with AHSA1/START domain